MNIDNFEDYIDAEILSRGFDYYKAGNIVDITNTGSDEYIFQVQGNQEY